MNEITAVIAFLAVMNPARTRAGLPEDAGGRTRVGVVAVGSAVAFGVLWGGAAVSGPLLDLLEISPETFRLAAGLVVVLVGFRSLMMPVPGAEPELPGWGAAWWPVAFPRLLTPSAVVLVVTVGSLDGVGMAVLGGGAATVATVAIGLLPIRGIRDAALSRVGQFLAAATVVVGIFLAIEGIRDV